jgi:hypothetical protein
MTLENTDDKKTEQEYLELANHAKQQIEIKDQEIDRLNWENKQHKMAIRKMKNIIDNLTETSKKMDNLLHFHKSNLGTIMKMFYQQIEDCNTTMCINLDDMGSLSTSESESEEEEDTDPLSLGTILHLLGEQRETLRSSPIHP